MGKSSAQFQSFAIAIAFSIMFTTVVPLLFAEDSKIPLIKDLPIDVKRKFVNLAKTQGSNKYSSTISFAEIPLSICGIGIDVSIKGNTNLDICCELEIAGQKISFVLNDLSCYFELGYDDVTIGGKVNPSGLVNIGLTIDADGVIENMPRLVFYHYSLSIE
ncbi:MAG: hypothetical protein QCH99_03690 [Candidatus Bathyarchaeota archaeon]|nr:hypothetical protein [Candidatus Bathyarchaeum tardum]